MKEYLKSAEDVIAEQESSSAGLSSSEAGRRLSIHGGNRLAEAKKESLIKKFFAELADPMIIILLVAAVISTVTELYEANWAFKFPADALIILFVVIVNAVLGVIQESKAEKAMDALRRGCVRQLTSVSRNISAFSSLPMVRTPLCILC